MKSRWMASIVLIALGSCFTPDARASSVRLEAEAAAAGADWSGSISDAEPGTFYRTILSNAAGESPGSDARVLTFTVNFPAAGAYKLYARVRVGPGSGNDDSFFYANGFGTKSPTNAADWIRVNNLLSGGFTDTNAIVFNSGSAGISVWKWLNLSEFANSASEPGITFNVSAGDLTQTFQVGAREDGLDMDAFLFGTASNTFTVAELDAAGPGTPPVFRPRDLVSGNLILFNDNGAWSWYMDERAVVDSTRGKLIVGSDASGAGVGSAPRNGNIEAVIFDLQTGTRTTSVLLSTGGHGFGCDDHNAPGFLVRPDNKYLAIYAGHNNDDFSYYRIYDGTNWGSEQAFDWSLQPGGTDFPTTYSNPHYLPAEGRTYNLARGNGHGAQNIMLSTNFGTTWSYGGMTTTNSNIGYVNGYFRYSDNGERIDFICTEYHPRDFDTSIYHGYLKNGQTFRSDGTVVDTNVFDKDPVRPQSFTPVFLTGTVLPLGQTNSRCWNLDVQRYPDGSVGALIKTRVNDNASAPSSDPDHAFFYCRYDGTNWARTYLSKAGKKLYGSEQDYTGLGALCPNDPNTIFISTPFDPRNNTNLLVHEIFKGMTTNHGASWHWTPLTRDSVRDNLRPIVPAWDRNNTVLLWWRGKYTSAQQFDAAVVGIIDRRAEAPNKMVYVDATTNNTTLAGGAALVPAPGLNQWHERAGAGNGGSVLASADETGENAPMLKTLITLPGPGTYDLWVNFWGSPGADWRIMAGLSTNRLHIFRQHASQQVEPGEHITSLVLSNDTNAFLYQAYLGRVTASGSTNIPVFVDDNALATGTTNPLIGDTVRTWYDGISFARIVRLQITNATFNSNSNRTTITWTSTPPGASLGEPIYSVQRQSSLTDTDWITLANGLPSEGTNTSFTDSSATGAEAFYRVSSP